MLRHISLVMTAAAVLLPSHVCAQEVGLERDRIEPTQPIARGLAPAMQWKRVKHTETEDTYVLIFRKGDELLSGISDFAREHDIGNAHFTAIGASSGAVLGYLDLAHKNYEPLRVDDQVEVLSFMGDIARFDAQPSVHAHAILGRRDGSTIGGHVWRIVVNPTVELFMTVNREPLEKRPDPQSGMRLIDPEL